MNMIIMLLLGVIGSISVFHCSKNSYSTMKNFLIGFFTLFFSSVIIFSLVIFYRFKAGNAIDTIDLLIGTGCILGACFICGFKCATTFNTN